VLCILTVSACDDRVRDPGSGGDGSGGVDAGKDIDGGVEAGDTAVGEAADGDTSVAGDAGPGDAETGGDADVQDAGADADSSTEPSCIPEQELCDGVDNDCDSLTDELREVPDGHCEVLECVPGLGAVQISDAGPHPGRAGGPRMVWTGREFGVVWYEDDGLRFRRIGPDGRHAGPIHRVPGPNEVVWDRTIVWNGSEFGIGYGEYPALDYWLVRVAPDGRMEDPVQLVPPEQEPIQLGGGRMAWTGDGYAVVTPAGLEEQSSFEISTFSPEGVARDHVSVAVTPDPSRLIGGFGVAVGTQGTGLAWVYRIDEARPTPKHLYFTSLGPDGERAAPDTLLADDVWETLPGVVWTGRHYAVVWEDLRHDDRATCREEGRLRADCRGVVYLALVDTDGNVRIEEPVSDKDVLQGGFPGGGPTAAWSGGRLGVMWYSVRDQAFSDGEVDLRILDGDGTPLDWLTLSAEDQETSSGPVMAWSGGGFGAAWGESSLGRTSEVVFLAMDEQGQRQCELGR